MSVRYYQFSARSLPVLCRYFAWSSWRLHSFRVLTPAFGTHCYCQCSANSLHCVSCLAAICSHVMQETVPELFPKPVKLRPSGSKNTQEIIQNEPSGASGDILEASRFQDREKVSAPDTFSRGFGHHCVDFWSSCRTSITAPPSLSW